MIYQMTLRYCAKWWRTIVKCLQRTVLWHKMALCAIRMFAILYSFLEDRSWKHSWPGLKTYVLMVAACVSSAWYRLASTGYREKVNHPSCAAHQELTNDQEDLWRSHTTKLEGDQALIVGIRRCTVYIYDPSFQRTSHYSVLLQIVQGDVWMYTMMPWEPCEGAARQESCRSTTGQGLTADGTRSRSFNVFGKSDRANCFLFPS